MLDAGTDKDRLLPPLWVITLMGAALFLWLLVELREIVALLVVGFAVAYVIEPILELLEKVKVRRSIGIVLILLLSVFFILFLILTAIPTLSREYQEMSSRFPEYVSTIKELAAPYLERHRDSLPVETVIDSPLDALSSFMSSGFANKLMAAISEALLSGYSLTLTLINLALLPFIVFYLSVGFGNIKPDFLKFFKLSQRRRVAAILSEIDMNLSAFVRGQLSIAALLCLLYALGLGLIGVELWVLVAVVAGFGNLIPYLGSVIGIVLASIMTLVTFGDISHLFMVWGVFAIVQFLEGSLITPRILGTKVGLSPLVVLLAIVAGGQLFGLLGIFLAVPGAAALRVLGQHMHGWVLERS